MQVDKSRYGALAWLAAFDERQRGEARAAFPVASTDGAAVRPENHRVIRGMPMPLALVVKRA